MKQAFALMMLIAVLLQLGYLWAGYETMYQIGYGAITLMGLMISLTFLWLYRCAGDAAWLWVWPIAGPGRALFWAGGGFYSVSGRA